MAKQRKKIRMVITLSVPVDMTPSQARKEVRQLITHQRNHSADPDDVKALKVAGVPRDYTGWRALLS